MNRLHRVLLVSSLAIGAGFSARAATEPPAPAGTELGASVDGDLKLEMSEIDAAWLSAEMIERMAAVKRLGALAGTLDPRQLEASLAAALADSHPAVAYQAEVELARAKGIDLLAAKRDELRVERRREELEECRTALASAERLDRLSAIEHLTSMGRNPAASAAVRALLAIATSDADPAVASQARLVLARFEGVDLIAPGLRASHRLAEERRQVDEWETALGSAEMIERLMAVKGLSAFVDQALEPERALSLLRAALSDPDRNVALQAQRVFELREGK